MVKKLGRKLDADEAYSVKDGGAVTIRSPKLVKSITETALGKKRTTYMIQGHNGKEGEKHAKVSKIISKERALSLAGKKGLAGVSRASHKEKKAAKPKTLKIGASLACRRVALRAAEHCEDKRVYKAIMAAEKKKKVKKPKKEGEKKKKAKKAKK